MGFLDLFRPKWRHSSWHVRKKAVDGLNEQKILANIVRNDNDSVVRKAAVNKLKDQGLLAEIAREDSVPAIRKAAMVNVLDKQLLAELAKGAKYIDVRKAAVHKLGDQALIADIARNDNDSGVRKAAVNKLKDQGLLAEIAREDHVPAIRKAAIVNLQDKQLLAELAKSAEYSDVRKAAMDKATMDKATAPHSLEESFLFLESNEFHTAVEEAKRTRDLAHAEKWRRQGSPGRGKPHHCKMCHKTIYGEETVIELQKQALYVQHNPLEAQRVEQMSGYRCQNCGNEYCKDCLEKKAPSNSYGGKSCPACYGLFEIIHG